MQSLTSNALVNLVLTSVAGGGAIEGRLREHGRALDAECVRKSPSN
jgi:hypothetical protein